MGDTAVDFFLETLKQLITSSNSDLIIAKKDQLQSLENEIKYLRGFLKITEKKRYEYEEVMKLVMQIREVISKAENIVELFMVLVLKADHASDSLREHQDFLEGVKKKRSSVKEKIKTLTDEVKHIYEENIPLVLYDDPIFTMESLILVPEASVIDVAAVSTSSMAMVTVFVASCCGFASPNMMHFTILHHGYCLTYYTCQMVFHTAAAVVGISCFCYALYPAYLVLLYALPNGSATVRSAILMLV
ncbi:hypothetical protein RHGRI_035131 [Rhododendron griersonianum]|uniref:Disease resistance N-terminal domain-containing protein n=1 Tax=Rhododendron griersonianum TaxID=479676 RepID=A0AAV6I3G6_9ERIC|nr:hypothetical protein RHGRI_035131 [Rhododendron griersonianum]